MFSCSRIKNFQTKGKKNTFTFTRMSNFCERQTIFLSVCIQSLGSNFKQQMGTNEPWCVPPGWCGRLQGMRAHCVNMGRWVSDVPRLPSHQFSLHTCAPLPAWTKLLLYSKHEHKMREKPGIPQASGKVIQRAGRKKPLIACRSELHLCTNSYQLSPTLPVLKSEVFARWIIRAWHLSAEWESYWTAATVSWGVNHVPERTFESVRYCVVCV